MANFHAVNKLIIIIHIFWLLTCLNENSLRDRSALLNDNPVITDNLKTALTENQIILIMNSFTLKDTINNVFFTIGINGVMNAQINNRTFFQEALLSGWTSYTRRVNNSTYNVTKYIKQGGNQITITLAPGWYACSCTHGLPAT